MALSAKDPRRVHQKMHDEDLVAAEVRRASKYLRHTVEQITSTSQITESMDDSKSHVHEDVDLSHDHGGEGI